MARNFDGIDDLIQATIAEVPAGSDWTIAAWVYPRSAGEGTAARIVQVEGAAVSIRQQLRFNGSTRVLRVFQALSPTNAVSGTTTVLAANAWSCVVATFRASDKTCRAYVGTQSAPMAEVAYSVQTPGVGTQSAGGTLANMGNSSDTASTHNGLLALVVVTAREWAAEEMESYRLGRRPVQAGNMRGFWPLDSPNATQASDLSGAGAHGTVTGATVAEDPPIPMGWGPFETIAVRYVPPIDVSAGPASLKWRAGQPSPKWMVGAAVIE